MRNEAVLKNGMGYVKMHDFHGNPLYDSREWGRPTNSFLSKVLLSLELSNWCQIKP